MTSPGVLIAIEGVDGAGKHTQVRALRRELERRGKPVSEYSFPDYHCSHLGVTIKEMLAGRFGDASKIHPALSAPLFALERAEKRAAIRQDLAAGLTVICDRYVYSNYAHQACRLPQGERQLFRIWLEKLEFGTLGLPQADVTVLLDVEDQVGANRRRARALELPFERPLDDYERDEVGISVARSIYLSLAADLNWIVVQTMLNGKQLDREATAREVFARIRTLIPELQ